KPAYSRSQHTRLVTTGFGWHWVSFLGRPSLLVYKVRLGSELLAEKSMKKPYCRSLVRKKDFDFSLKWRSCLSISVVHFKLIFDQHVDHLLIIVFLLTGVFSFIETTFYYLFHLYYFYFIFVF